MPSKASIISSIMLWAIMALTLGSCLKKTPKSNKMNNDQMFNLVFYYDNPFAQSTIYSTAASSALSRLNGIQDINEANLRAIGACNCATELSGEYLNKLIISHGIIPQVLVPAIRNEIRGNSVLNFLVGAGGFFSMLASDKRISTEVRKALNKKISASLPTGSNMVNDIKPYFDMFHSPFNLTSGSNSSVGTFNTLQQAHKWQFIMSLENLWGVNPDNQQPLGYRDHSVQLFATAITMSEWSYAFGLDSSPNGGGIYGGITIDPALGLTAPLRAFDARVNVTGSAIITGNYTVNFPQSSSAVMALNATESWTRSGTSVPLSEQALIWDSAALAYLRLKPSSRTAITKQIFSPNAILPDESHLLALSFLPGLAALLDGPFADTKSQFIREYAIVPGTQGADVRLGATLSSLNMLTKALISWNLALADSDKDGLSDSISRTINESKPKLKDALRLSLQATLDNYVVSRIPGSRLGSIGLVTSLTNTQPPDLALAAETLALFAIADQSVFSEGSSGTDFQKKITGLFHWFAATYLADIAKGQSSGFPSAQAVIWSKIALHWFARYPISTHQAAWLNDALVKLDTAIKNWDGSAQ